jgi:arylsulfatase
VHVWIHDIIIIGMMMTSPLDWRNTTLRNVRFQMAAVLATGVPLGYLAAVGRFNPIPKADAAPPAGEASTAKPAEPSSATTAVCCDAANKGQLVARASHNARVAGAAQKDGKKPNILIIWGDDIGWFNPSCYHGGVKGY